MDHKEKRKIERAKLMQKRREILQKRESIKQMRQSKLLSLSSSNSSKRSLTKLVNGQAEQFDLKRSLSPVETISDSEEKFPNFYELL